MLRISSVGFTGIVLAGLFTAGCASQTPARSSLQQTAQGVKCSKCDVTYVQVPVSATKGPRIVGYRTEKQMECPDCKDAAQSFFASGKLQHTCKTCGDSMEICQAH